MAPHSMPWAGSIRTGTASIQYRRGPGWNATCPAQPDAWLNSPATGGRELNTAHERMAIIVSTPLGSPSLHDLHQRDEKEPHLGDGVTHDSRGPLRPAVAR